MHSVVELASFTRGAEACSLTPSDVAAIVDIVSNNPMLGAVIPGTGGCRKIRIAGRGKGKSGGYRTIYFFSGDDMPIFLLAVYGKGEKDNLTQLERNQLAAKTGELVELYKRQQR